jgi:hypothetical protein
VKAIVAPKYGPPNVLQLREITKPFPKENEALVKVHASSVNSADLEALGGDFATRITGPFSPIHKIPGSDIAGRIEAVGRNVKRFQPGDEIWGDLSFPLHYGAFAEYVCVPESSLRLKSPNLTFKQAAAIVLAACSSVGSGEPTTTALSLFTTVTTVASATNAPTLPPTIIFTPTITPKHTFPLMTPTSTSTEFPTRTPAPSDLSGQVVYAHIVDTSQIFVADLDTGEINQLTDIGSNLNPVWSPDGDQIVFISNRDGDLDIYLMNKDGSNQRRLTNFEGNELMPDWSPKGNRIIFVSEVAGNNEIYMLDLETMKITRLTFYNGLDLSPAWSSDSTRIAFVRSYMENDSFQTFQVHTMDTNGKNIEQITEGNYLTRV